MYHNFIPQTQRPALMQEEAVGIEGLQRELGGGSIRETGSRGPWLWSTSFPLPHGTSNSQGPGKGKRDAQNEAPKRPLLSECVRSLVPTLGVDFEDAC